MHRRYRARASGISGQLNGHGVKIGEKFVVVTLGEGGKQSHAEVGDRLRGRHRLQRRDAEWQDLQDEQQGHLGAVCVRGSVNGKPFTAQVERGAGKNPLAMRVAHDGTQVEAMVLSPLRRATARADALQGAAGSEQVPDVADARPAGRGSVQPGQQVQAGEKLAVIEAMKMENVLFASQDGVVGKIVAAKGESLAVDQVILEFV